MATKKQQQSFYEDVLEYIVSIGAKNRHIGEICSHYKLDTIAGELFIFLETPQASKIFSICTRFEDEKKAKVYLLHGTFNRLNPYSGKWNFHNYSADETLIRFKMELTPLLLPVSELIA